MKHGGMVQLKVLLSGLKNFHLGFHSYTKRAKKFGLNIHASVSAKAIKFCQDATILDRFSDSTGL